MTRKILFATTNPHKKKRFQAYFKTLGLKVISLPDLKGKMEVVEDGKTAEENALKKAMAGYRLARIPTFGVDYWLWIKGFTKKMQPGPYVRRIFVGKGNQRMEASDEEMLEYYMRKIKALGGRTKGIWTSAIALVISPNQAYTKSLTRETILISKRSPKKTEGEPLNSIQIDLRSNKYFTDFTADEWLNLEKEREREYINFMKKHLQEI